MGLNYLDRTTPPTSAVFVGVGAASRFEELQEEAVRGQSHAVATRVRLSYYQLLLSREQLRLTENSVRRVRESVRETRARNESGLASDYDLLRLEVELANLEPNLQRAQNSVREIRRQLSIELDVAKEDELTVKGALADMDLDNLENNDADNREILEFMGFQGRDLDLSDRAVRMASELRSDLRQLELNQDIRQSEVRLEQARYLPEVTLFGNYIINAQDNGSPNFFARGDGQRAYSRIVGVRVSVPVFQGFRRVSRVDQKRAALRSAEVQSQRGRDMARAQVESLSELSVEALSRARAQKLAVHQATRGFEIASAQYREGLGGQFELIDAEVALRQSEFNYAQAVFDYLVARAQLDEATGLVPFVDQDAIQTSEEGYELP